MYILQNYNEVLVDNYLKEILPEYKDICKCEKCILDIKAIALNNLPPKYVASEEGAIYIKVEHRFDIQGNADIARAIVSAIEIVSKNPKHG